MNSNGTGIPAAAVARISDKTTQTGFLRLNGRRAAAAHSRLNPSALLLSAFRLSSGLKAAVVHRRATALTPVRQMPGHVAADAGVTGIAGADATGAVAAAVNADRVAAAGKRYLLGAEIYAETTARTAVSHKEVLQDF